jgi:outer membrane lipoprotein-sorting protein
MTTMQRRSLLLGFAAAAGTTLVGTRAHALDVDEVLDKITEARKEIRTLQARFDQKRVISLLASEVNSNGKLALVRKSQRLRWDLNPPDEVTYWIGPDGIAMKNKDGVTKIPKSSATKFAAVLDDLMVMLGGDVKKLKDRYEISAEESEGKVYMTFVPSADDVKKHISRLEVVVSSDYALVRRVIITETNDDSSTIAFRKYKKNKSIEDSHMKPPKS